MPTGTDTITLTRTLQLTGTRTITTTTMHIHTIPVGVMSSSNVKSCTKTTTMPPRIASGYANVACSH
ncbi:hypothetical protein [Paraburkholderia adhaesiva]|uniref:hypothetical protein n=1 Tax=Paraburkholderia adhaesiva TaxID=2883244 RepID=UPI0027E54E0B|nr:hypothetical protein [Paraburkholderia adhaesiva]